MAESAGRAYLRRALEAHLTQLGYSGVRARRPGVTMPEVVRVSPVRGRLAYGEIVLRSDLKSRRCHERLLAFSERRTRRRSSILFFIGVAEADQQAVEEVLVQLDIRSGTRGGHVHVVAIPPQERPQPRPAREQRA